MNQIAFSLFSILLCLNLVACQGGTTTVTGQPYLAAPAPVPFPSPAPGPGPVTPQPTPNFIDLVSAQALGSAYNLISTTYNANLTLSRITPPMVLTSSPGHYTVNLVVFQ